MPNPANNKTNLTRGYTAALFSAVTLSTTAILIRMLTLDYRLPALVLAFWREVIVALSMVIGLGVIKRTLLRVPNKMIPYLLLYGLVLALFNALWTLSVSLNGAAVATVLSYCSAAFTALLGHWVLKERLDWAKLLAVGLCLCGCALVSGALDPSAWQVNLLGILTGVLSGLLYAVYSLMGRSASQRGLNSWTTLTYTFGMAAIFMLTFNLLGKGFIPGTISRLNDFLWLGKVWSGWGILILLAVGPTLAGYGLYNLSLTYLPSSVANLITTLEPPFTAIIAYFSLGERLSLIQAMGSLLILGGVVFMRLHEGRMDAKMPAQPDAQAIQGISTER